MTPLRQNRSRLDAASPFTRMEQRDFEILSTHFPHLVVHRVVLSMDASVPSFFDELAAGPAHGRRGEAVLGILHRDGGVWLHTKQFYPAGAYRLPSGGIGLDELTLDAAQRELREETGLDLEPCDCAGILCCRLQRANRTLDFTSYVFLFPGDLAVPASRDPGEQISDYRLVDRDALPGVAQTLRRLPPAWQDWGAFRALAHDFLFDYLQR